MLTKELVYSSFKDPNFVYPKSILHYQSHAKHWVWVMESIMCFKSCLHSHYDGNLANGTLIKKITLISPGTLFKGFKGGQCVVTHDKMQFSKKIYQSKGVCYSVTNVIKLQLSLIPKPVCCYTRQNAIF